MSSALRQEGDFRYTEELLSAGDQLSVLGELRSHSEIADPDDSAAALLHRWKQDQKGLLARFDKDHDGRLDSAEWEAARQAAEVESRSKAPDSRISRLSVITQPGNGEPFLVAGMDDARLVRRERVHAAMFFALGLLGMVLCASAIEHARMTAAAAGRGLHQGGDVPVDVILWALISVGGALASRIRGRLA